MSVSRLLFPVLALVAVVLASAAGFRPVFAGDPLGVSPSNAALLGAGASETCLNQTLAPGAPMWFQVPYHSGKDLEIYARGDAAVDLAVFDPRQISSYPQLDKPTGLLTPNRNEPQYSKSWLGHLWLGTVSGSYFVRGINNSAGPVTFSLCTAEREQFFPPPAPWPTALPCPPVGTFGIIINPCDGPITTSTN